MRGIALRAVLVSSLVLLLFGAAFGQTNIPVGNHPRSLTVGDFDRDGWDDFAVANELSNNITVCVAQQDGSFECKDDAVDHGKYEPVIPMAIDSADLNGDAKADLALAACGLTLVKKESERGETYVTAEYNVFTFEGKGDGSFEIEDEFKAGDCPSAIAIADLDLDGKLELVVANSGSNDITVIDGSRQKDFSVGKTPVALAVGDFNRDAKPDVVVANSGSNDLSVCLGTGNSAYLTCESSTIPVGQRPLDVEPGDFNCDNILDLVVANFGSDDVWTFFGDGEGNFGHVANGEFKANEPDKTYRVDQAPSALVVEDLNQDCKLDIAVTNAFANDVWVFSGRLSGKFETVSKFAVGHKPVAIISGDFDKGRDGNPDLVVANELSNNITILWGEGGDFFRYQVAKNDPPVADFSYSPAQPKAEETVEFDGSSSSDPDGEVVSWTWDFGDENTGSGKIVEHSYAEKGEYQVCLTVEDDRGAEDEACESLSVTAAAEEAEPTKTPTVGQEPSAIASGDFNGDGQDDLAVVNQAGGDITVLLGAGEGKFSIKGSTPVGQSPSGIETADFNKDNQLDLAVTNAGSNTVSILTGDGKGAFHARSTPAVGSNPMSVTAGEIDADDNIDLAVANSGSNNVSILLGNGDGSFKEAINTETTGNSPEALGLGDLDGDGNLDLVVSNLNSNDLAILLGNGEGTFTVGTKLTGLNHPRSVGLHDFNGDGKLDIAVADSDSNAAVVFLGTGEGNFQEQRVSAKVGESPRGIAAADFNDDGQVDLALANYSSNNASVMLGKGDGTFEEQRVSGTGQKPNDVIAANFNADGYIDLAAANSGSNDVTVLLGRGDGTFEDPPLGFMNSAWSGVLVGGLGSLILFPVILWLWGVWADEERRNSLLVRLGLGR